MCVYLLLLNMSRSSPYILTSSSKCRYLTYSLIYISTIIFAGIICLINYSVSTFNRFFLIPMIACFVYAGVESVILFASLWSSAYKRLGDVIVVENSGISVGLNDGYYGGYGTYGNYGAYNGYRTNVQIYSPTYPAPNPFNGPANAYPQYNYQQQQPGYYNQQPHYNYPQKQQQQPYSQPYSQPVQSPQRPQQSPQLRAKNSSPSSSSPSALNQTRATTVNQTIKLSNAKPKSPQNSYNESIVSAKQDQNPFAMIADRHL